MEKEADVMGRKAMQMKAFTSSKGTIHQREINQTEIQRKEAPSGIVGGGVVQKVDVVEDIVLEGYSKDKDRIKTDLANCIDKFKNAINTAFDSLVDDRVGYSRLDRQLTEDGRDAFFYRSIFKKYKRGLLGDLHRFNKDWHVAQTGGLLADIGLALKRIPMPIFTGGLSFSDIMPDYQREGSDHIRGRGPKSSHWADDLEYNKMKGNAGPSSTTTQLLHVVSSIGGFSNKEVEAMMIALVKFWKGGMKRTFGKGHHTAIEVWAPYTGYLEAQAQKSKEE